jgi:transcriptional antiterminator RfaH
MTAWYVLRSKPNKEDFLWGQVLAHQIEVFYPSIRVKAVNPRARKVKPYFPGYLFIRVELDEVSKSFWHWLPGSSGLISFNETPALVPEALVDAIRRKCEAINAAGGEQLASLQHGDPVTIQSGPFAEYEAIFDKCISGNERVRVLLKVLKDGRIPVELPVEQVKRTKQPA